MLIFVVVVDLISILINDTFFIYFCIEIVIFCNRDARCDQLFKAATVFEKGRKLSVQLGMKPVTSQVFIQV